jgi:hypothetical protein
MEPGDDFRRDLFLFDLLGQKPLQLGHFGERLLREAVQSISTDENPATRWLMATSVGAGLSGVCCFGLLVFALSRIA